MDIEKSTDILLKLTLKDKLLLIDYLYFIQKDIKYNKILGLIEMAKDINIYNNKILSEWLSEMLDLSNINYKNTYNPKNVIGKYFLFYLIIKRDDPEILIKEKTNSNLKRLYEKNFKKYGLNIGQVYYTVSNLKKKLKTSESFRLKCYYFESLLNY